MMLKYLTITICVIAMVNIVSSTICASQDSAEFVSSSSSSSSASSPNDPCFDLSQYDYDGNKKVQQEKDVELECYVKNKGPYYVAWLYENQPVSLNDKVIRPDASIHLDSDGIRKFNLKISNVGVTHKGAYKCQILTLVAKNLEYSLDVLVPPTISRIPSSDIITLNEGDSITLQCLGEGNPKPKITWTKRGEKAVHTTVDESKSTLSLENVDESHADTYSCTAKNGVGNPVTSEFQILIRFKPKVVIVEDENVNRTVLYSTNGRKERVKFVIDAYPAPKITLLHNDIPIPVENYVYEESKDNNKQYFLTYSFTGSSDSFGNYACVAENEMGNSKAEIKVTGYPSEVTISNDKLPVYSDAILFEWSVLSGSSIQELNVQVFTENNTNGTNIITKTKQILNDGTELPPTYHNENIQYKDFYDISKLISNTSYTIRLKVKNEFEWSEWSQNLTIKTHSDDNLPRHKSQFSLHHHRHHDRKHKNGAQSASNLNTKRDRYNSYMSENNAAIKTSFNFVFVMTNAIFFRYFF